MKKISAEYLTVKNHQIYLRKNKSSKSAPNILFIHGLAVSGTYFLPTAKILSQYTNVFIPDLPGYGKSPKSKYKLTLNEYRDFVYQIISKLELDSVVLFANSFGCQIAVELAIKYPQIVSKLILTGPTVDPKKRNFFSQLGLIILDGFYEPISYFPILIHDVFKMGISKLLHLSEVALNDEIEKDLPHVTQPTLIIRGEKDPIVTQDWAQKAARLLQRGKLKVIPAAGHVVNYNSPKKVSHLVTEFLKD